jgi:hypothetical protein
LRTIVLFQQPNQQMISKRLQAVIAAFQGMGATIAKGKDPFSKRRMYFFSLPPHTTDEDLKSLPEVSCLFGLSLNGTRVTDAGLMTIATFAKISWLGLGQTRLTDEGMREIAKLKNLTALHLDHTQITDLGLREIASFPL